MECNIYCTGGWLFTLVCSFLYNPLPQSTSFYYCISFTPNVLVQPEIQPAGICDQSVCNCLLPLVLPFCAFSFSAFPSKFFLFCFLFLLSLSYFIFCKSTSDLMSYHDVKKQSVLYAIGEICNSDNTQISWDVFKLLPKHHITHHSQKRLILPLPLFQEATSPER